MKKLLLSVLAFTLVCLSVNLVFAANTKPAVGTVTSASGTSNPYQPVNFKTTYTDVNGWQDIQYVNLIVNNSTSGANCFYAQYNLATKQLYLRNDANTAWLGGVVPGALSIIENSYVKLNCSQTTVSGSGTTLTVNWNVTFKTTFTGTKYTYLYVKDKANAYAGLTMKGNWKINANTMPQTGTIIPSSGISSVNTPVNISATYSDANSVEDIRYAYILFNTSTSLTNCLYAYYDRNTDRLYLRDDANKTWLGGFAPGSANVIENSYVRLECSSTKISQQANILTVNWALSFKYIFTGTKNVYLYVTDNAGSYNGWVNKGTRTINALFYWSVVDECDKPLPTQGYYYNYTGGTRGLMNAEKEIAYQWDGNSSYSATALINPGGFGWAWAGMWYSLIKGTNDNAPLDFKAIFGSYVKKEYQGEVTDIEIVVNKVQSPSNNSSLCFTIELKEESGNIIGTQQFTNIKSLTYPRTFTWSLPEIYKKKVKLVSWILDKAKKGDTISIDRIRLRTLVPDLGKTPSQEQAFLWTFSWLMTNYNPATGMVQDRSNFKTGDFENITATAKLAKIIYYAYKKGYVSREDATAVITKIANTLTYRVPRGPSGKNILWPHFTRNGGTVAIAPHDGYAGTEWSSGDTAYAALDIITALQLIGDPQAQLGPLENFLKQISWPDLLSDDKFIGHGYTYEGNKIPYFWGGFGMETIGVNWAYASSTGNRAKMSTPPSDNGSGFIDNVPYPVVFSGTDVWGNNWDAYRNSMADTQIGWYNVSGYNKYLANTGLFGLSAAETPESDGGYQAYGIGGKNVAFNDGNSEVVVLHYSGMISDIRPAQAVRMWEVMRDKSAVISQNKILISPLNNIESMRISKASGKCTANYLKGSWNMALQAEGWAMYDAAIRNDLARAVQNNAFLKKGYDLFKGKPPLRVPQDYPNIQRAIDAAVKGDVISVTAGTYNEVLTLNKSGITLLGDNRSSIIQGTSGSAVINCQDINGDETVISGFKITGGLYGIKCSKTVKSLKIDNNNITRNLVETIGYGIYLDSGASAVIQNNDITYSGKGIYAVDQNTVSILNNYFYYCRASYGGGVYFDSAGNVLIKGNTFTECWDGAINLRSSTVANVISNKFINNGAWNSCPGVNITGSTATLKNNLFVNNRVNNGGGSNGVYAYDSNKTPPTNSVALYNNTFSYTLSGNFGSYSTSLYFGDVNVIAKNNIFYQTSNKPIAYSEKNGTQDFSYNALWSTTGIPSMVGITRGAGNITADPLFVDQTNFYLKPGSPCVNTGDPNPQYNDKDGTRNNMGIYGGPDSM